MIPTAVEVAEFMIEQIRTRGRVSKPEMDALIAAEWGEGVTMDHAIQSRFRYVHAGTIRWVERGHYWEPVA